MPSLDVPPFWRDLDTFLRRVLSGYVYVMLTAPLWVNLWMLTQDFGMALALLIIAGIVIGSVTYDAWNFVFWYVAWHCRRCRECWRLDHIKTLKDGLKDGSQEEDDQHLKAIWDAVFFRKKEDEVQTRILNVLLTWLIFQPPKEASPSLVVTYFFGAAAAILLALNHWRLCRDAGVLENLFLKEQWPEVQAAVRVLKRNPQ
jgi:hypothetical protein